jgi:hypothetical protein
MTFMIMTDLTLFVFEANFASSFAVLERGRLTLRGLINLAPNEAYVHARRPLPELSVCAPGVLMGDTSHGICHRFDRLGQNT